MVHFCFSSIRSDYFSLCGTAYIVTSNSIKGAVVQCPATSWHPVLVLHGFDELKASPIVCCNLRMIYSTFVCFLRMHTCTIEL